MALQKINNPMRDDMYFSKKTGKYKVDLSRFGVKGKVEDKHPTPAMKSARRKALRKAKGRIGTKSNPLPIDHESYTH